LKSKYFAKHVAIDLPKVICSLGILAEVTEVAVALGAEMLAPQPPQNFTSLEFSLPHFGQNILLSLPLDKESNNTGARAVWQLSNWC
jgi:hypothetical protein